MNDLHHVTVADGRSLDVRISGPATGTPLVGEGHLSVVGAIDRMLDELVGTMS